jgi:thiol-disulfide isomerase/thioredoxin
MLPAFFLFFASLVNDVRDLIGRNDLAAAENAARTYSAQAGKTPELAAAVSWLGRGALAAKKHGEAERFAKEARELSLALMKTHKLDSEPWLPVALGASIEVQAQVMAARGERSEAVTFLREQVALYGATSLHERIRKNLNLLSLQGQTAPELDVREWIGAKPQTLASLRGRPVLLFFWAHWCSDCKGMVKSVASVMKTYGPKGLALVAPTKRYGYVAGGEDATPAVEKPYIEKVRGQFYSELGQMPMPVSAANFQQYGSSSTPTVVLVDRAGKVRYYHPGAINEQELAAEVAKVMAK